MSLHCFANEEFSVICFNACSTEKRISKPRNYILISRKLQNHLITFYDVIGQSERTEMESRALAVELTI